MRDHEREHVPKYVLVLGFERLACLLGRSDRRQPRRRLAQLRSERLGHALDGLFDQPPVVRLRSAQHAIHPTRANGLSASRSAVPRVSFSPSRTMTLMKNSATRTTNGGPPMRARRIVGVGLTAVGARRDNVADGSRSGRGEVRGVTEDDEQQLSHNRRQGRPVAVVDAGTPVGNRSRTRPPRSTCGTTTAGTSA